MGVQEQVAFMRPVLVYPPVGCADSPRGHAFTPFGRSGRPIRLSVFCGQNTRPGRAPDGAVASLRIIPQSLRDSPRGHAFTPFGRSGRPFGILRAKYQDQPRIQVVKYPEPEDIPSEKHLSVRESRSFPGWNAQIGRSVRRNGGFPGRKS